MTVRIGIAGISGRMGREVLAAAETDPAWQVVGGVVRRGSDRSSALVNADLQFVDEVEALLPAVEVLVDFTAPSATIGHAEACARTATPLVCGVTGLGPNETAALEGAARLIPVFYARNMSIGLSALQNLLPALVRSLDGYDVEIVEAHHRHKTDAPSGTALALAETIAAVRDANLGDNAVYGRHGVAPRRDGEIGIHAVRGGGNAGEHSIVFADDGEEIRVVHRAFSRRTFALGALRAASFTATRPPGFYTMADLTLTPV